MSAYTPHAELLTIKARAVVLRICREGDSPSVLLSAVEFTTSVQEPIVKSANIYEIGTEDAVRRPSPQELIEKRWSRAERREATVKTLRLNPLSRFC
jgi:hypothetical protein